LRRARVALEGLSVGDALGGFWEFNARPSWLAARHTPTIEWHWTDDTLMALSVYETLRLHQKIDPDALALSFGTHYEPGRGYGMSMRFVLPRLAQGDDWRTVATSVFEGGSFGNGGPMKIAPLGAYYADDVDALPEIAALTSRVSHAHPEAQAGSVAVAVAAALAWNHRDGDPLPAREFIQQVIAHTPESEVRVGLERAAPLTLETPFEHVVTILGNGRRVSSMDSVPLAVWVAAVHPRDYAEAIWTVIAAGGDVDTLAAMTGGIVACGVGVEEIPATWRERREALPEWAIGG
jgi:ADP-ribosylglycohydrolase